jgi:hypothetical protein
MREFSIAQKAAFFDRLVEQGGVDFTKLVDFSTTLEAKIAELVELREPIWASPTTGQTASSVFAAFTALGFTTSKHWSAVVREARRYRSFHTRRDLPKGNPFYATICLDIRDIEDLVVTLAPRKGPKVVAKFKQENGIE